MEEVNSTPKMIVDLMAKQSSLNQSHRKLSEYIIRNFNEIAGIQSSVLAKCCGVSEPTITRFVKEMGYLNYRDFQVEVAKASAQQEGSKSGYPDIASDDDMKTICEKVIANNVQALTDTMSLLNIPRMEQVADMILHASRIIIFAQGRSSITAGSLQHRLMRLGFNCSVYSDSHVISTVSTLVKPNDLFFGISTFGRTSSVVKGMERARSNGAKVIGITSHTGVPIEQHADVLLFTVDNKSEPFELETSCATVTQMVMLDCLYMKVLLKMEESGFDHLHETYEALKDERL